jgi:hypothetical protein
MPELIPAFSETPSTESSPSVTFGSGFGFDFAAGEFILDHAGRTEVADPERAWALWCVKAALTPKGACAVYDPGFGVDFEALRAATTPEEKEVELQHAITEALLFDPRTASVEGFEFDWAGDEIHCAFTVTPVAGSSRRVDVRLQAAG